LVGWLVCWFVSWLSQASQVRLSKQVQSLHILG
jgi:hypothetical protein